ncbi:MAG: ABC transporter ATP-binding protein [Acidobacteria bacterium]|nr:ABC transporter ATP-binding protein [Acidobacteriota bacterium]
MTTHPSAEPGRPGIELAAHDLRKAFEHGLVTAVDGVTLEVRSGELVALVGPTGCGKSTLLALLGLIEEPDAGHVSIDGHMATLRGAERWRAENVGIVFQLHHLLPHLTVAENVQLPLVAAGLARTARRERADRLLAELGLAHRAGTLAARLSGGERQLAALARALANRPRLLLADEPTGSVDSRTGALILDRLLAWSREAGATLVLVTHDQAVAGAMDRVVAIKDGRVVGPG